MMMNRNEILYEFYPLCNSEHSGIESIISDKTQEPVFSRLENLAINPLSKSQLNQLLVFSGISEISDGCFDYYWLKHQEHFYELNHMPCLADISDEKRITSIQQLKWGLSRLFIDSLYFFGNINRGYDFLSKLSYQEIFEYFHSSKIKEEDLRNRDDAIELKYIEKENRRFTSEIIKGYIGTEKENKLKLLVINKLKELGYSETSDAMEKKLRIKDLFPDNEDLQFALIDLNNDALMTGNEMLILCDDIYNRFIQTRKLALLNTSLYLSMVKDMDIYIATSMRTKADFDNITDICDSMFSDEIIKSLKIRYFNPTISVVDGNENKGLVECLMVKCCKMLIYCAGNSESFGKDAEAATALSLGKPVIFLCKTEKQCNFYQNIHPLARMINVNTGVAVGAYVTCSINDVIELIRRHFTNSMKYRLEQNLPEYPGYYRLKDGITNSVVRLQTNNEIVSNSFWYYYLTKTV